MKGLNWRSVLRDLNVVLLTLLLVPVVVTVWLAAGACAKANALSPGCVLDQKGVPSLFFAAPKAKGAR